MTASTVKDVVDNLERYYDAFNGEKKSVDTILDRVDALLSPSVIVQQGNGGQELDYDGLLQDLNTKLQNGWFMESAEVKQIDKTTIEYLTRIMTHQGTMQTPRYRATIGEDFKITRIVAQNEAREDNVPVVTTVGEGNDDDDTVLRNIQAELDQAYGEPTEREEDVTISTLGED